VRRGLQPRSVARAGPARRLRLDQRRLLGGVQAPTGGVKDSGFGRERGLPGIRDGLAIKNVGIRL
jgi:acyl-CoA reductase-like NAD-dependent aldehyde dehydrogenase